LKEKTEFVILENPFLKNYKYIPPKKLFAMEIPPLAFPAVLFIVCYSCYMEKEKFAPLIPFFPHEKTIVSFYRKTENIY
jgi:hypothetical protein